MAAATASPETLDAVLHALADSTRRDIVSRTLRREASVTALARTYPMSFAAVQKHVAVLERAGLVVKRRSGREMLVTGRPEPVAAVSALMDQFEALWLGRHDRMADLLADSDPHRTTQPHEGASS